MEVFVATYLPTACKTHAFIRTLTSFCKSGRERCGSMKQGSRLSSVSNALQSLRNGEFVVVMDDESRENEGDLVIAAQFATEQQLAFMVRHTNGILCVTMPEKRSEQLGLPCMIPDNQDPRQTNFRLTADLLGGGVTTGASSFDRATTARAMADPERKANEFHRPGHVFPLVAKAKGVLERGGHTEASVDLCKLAGLEPVSVICELMHSDGTMCRFDACAEIAKRYSFPVITVDQIIQYRKSIGDVSMQPQIPFSPLDPPDKMQALGLVSSCMRSVPSFASAGTVEVQVNVYHDWLRDVHHTAFVYGNVRGASNPVLSFIHTVSNEELALSHFFGGGVGQVNSDCLASIESEGAGVILCVSKSSSLHNAGNVSPIPAKAAHDSWRFDVAEALLEKLGVVTSQRVQVLRQKSTEHELLKSSTGRSRNFFRGCALIAAAVGISFIVRRSK